MFYKRHKISYVTPCYRLWRNTTDEEHLAAQQQFVRDLVERMQDGREIIYMDETSFCLFDQGCRTWMNTKEPLVFKLPKERGASKTLLGAISTMKTDKLVYILADHTNTESVLKFMEKLVKKLDNPENAVLVMDNHKAHNSPCVKELLINLGVDILYMSTHSSNLNPIEKLWSVLKVYLHRVLFERGGHITEDEIPSVIKGIVKDHVNATVEAIALGGFDRMQKVLGGRIV